MMIDLNNISRAAFKNCLEFKDKQKLSFKERKSINDILLKQITSMRIDENQSTENYLKVLKFILAVCYLNNINLNDYIKVETNENII